ncbi:hypothetical protein CEXT_382481 [Caerostris extrusa]|uniref:Uncharacterized protein n=1 Tax=Caerostris extrusa TaxID=172846 RepID=A0AAV4T3C7_CAEEX|nr:hypothetical protein CEXT_382481 [Caerostris extrusa]
MYFPRSVFTVHFRLLTGHNFSQEHLCRIGRANISDYVLCSSGTFMDFTHLAICPALSLNCSPDNFYNKTGFYWAARGLMADMASSQRRRKKVLFVMCSGTSSTNQPSSPADIYRKTTCDIP